MVGEVVVGQHGGHHFGFTIDGAASEIFKVRAEWLHPIPESLSWTQAALVEPFSIAYNATVALGGVYPGDVIAVFGAGPIGLLSVLAAMANGGRAVVVEPSASRRERALALGASAALDPRAADIGDAVAETTNGRGFDGVIEASGSPAAMAQALQVAADGGRIAYVGINVGATAEARLGLIQQKITEHPGRRGFRRPVAARHPPARERCRRPDADRDRVVPARPGLGGARRGTRHREPHQGSHPA